jgi:hypothetical protein
MASTLSKMKTKTRYFLLCIWIISISIGIAFLPSRWLYILYGVLVLVIGSVVQTEEWKTRKRIRAVVFTVAIVGGGLLTTLGWNEWGNYSQKKALLTALAREWTVNELYQNVKPLSFDPNDPNLGEKHSAYRPFKTFTSNSILNSNLFNIRDKDERELCIEIMFYEMSASTCNELFVTLNKECTMNTSTKEQRMWVYQRLVRSPLYEDFKKSHVKIGMLLKKRYNWALEEAMLLPREGSKFRKILEEKYIWPSEEMLNKTDSK